MSIEIANDKIKREEKLWPEVVKYFDRDPSEWECAATVALVFFVLRSPLRRTHTRSEEVSI